MTIVMSSLQSVLNKSAFSWMQFPCIKSKNKYQSVDQFISDSEELNKAQLSLQGFNLQLGGSKAFLTRRQQ